MVNPTLELAKRVSLIDKTQEAVADLQSELQLAEKTAKTRELALTETLHNTTQDLKHKLQRLTDEKIENEYEAEELRTRLQSLGEEVKNLQEQNNTHEQEINTLNQQNLHLQTQLADSEDSLQQAAQLPDFTKRW